MNRDEIAELIISKLESKVEDLKLLYEESKENFGYFFVDDLLPLDLVNKIYKCFPTAENMSLKKSLREYKYVAAQMNNYNPLLEEVIYAFQNPRVVGLISRICGIDTLYPDEHLYAGGISLMGDKHYLNPHLDNSHDKDRNKWCALNLLYYVTPGWSIENGGNLEIWPDGLKAEQVTIHSKFNRLVIMATDNASWHSVSPISCENIARCCVSNYYFSDLPLKSSDQFHVTSFRGRPDQRVRDMVLQADIFLRMAIRRIFKKGIVENKHVYKK